MSKDEEKIYRQSNIENMIVQRLEDNPLPITDEHAKVIIDTFWDIIYDAMVDGFTVKLHGKGQFYLSQRSARVGRNPRTGITYDIPEREIMAYRVSDALSKRLRAERQKQIQT